MKNLLTLIFLFFSITLTSQILNVESLRKVTDTSGFTGSAGVGFSFKKDLNTFYELGSDIHVQYKMKKHLVLWKNDLNLKSIEGNRFQNSGVSHLRYNYRFHPRVGWEIFLQAQYNKVAKINFRGLLGTGPRFKLTDSEDYKVYFGTHIMLEQEELDDEVTPVQRDFRSTSYLSLSLHPTDRISIVSTTYFQPKIKKFNDFRLSSETSLAINLFSNFAFTTSYSFIYDQSPAVGIPPSQHTLKNGLAYTF